MRDLIEKTGRHGAQFAVALLLSRAIGFVLVPILSRALDTAEYGIADVLAIVGQILALVAGQGVPSAVFRGYSFTSSTAEERQRIVATGFLYVLLSALSVMGLAALWSRPLAYLATGDPDHALLLLIVLATYALSMLRNVCSQILRAEYRSGAFLFVYCGEFVLCAILNIVLVVFLKWGVKGILISNLIGALFAAGSAIGFVPAVLRPGFDRSLLPGFRRFGWPLVPPALSLLLLDSMDRFFFQWLLPGGNAVIGIYGRAMTVASILHGALIMPLTTLWPGVYYPLARRESAARDLGVCGALYAAVGLFLTVGLAAISRPLVELMVAPEYHAAATIVPILAFSLFCFGASEVFKIGLFVRDRTRALPLIMFWCVAANAALNLVLIPRIGMAGAAWASLSAYAIFAVLCLRASQRVFAVRHPWRRWGKAFAAALLCLGACALLPYDAASAGERVLQLLLRGGLVVVLYPASLLALRFFEASELAVARDWWRSRARR